MNPTRIFVSVGLIALNLVFIGGCQSTLPSNTTPSSSPPTGYYSPPPPTPSTQRAEFDPLAGLVTNLQAAPDAGAEASALRRIQEYETAHMLTHRVKTVRPETGTAVQHPSAIAGIVRVDVTIYRGQESVYTFSFIPRDNSNLSIMGE